MEVLKTALNTYPNLVGVSKLGYNWFTGNNYGVSSYPGEKGSNISYYSLHSIGIL